MQRVCFNEALERQQKVTSTSSRLTSKARFTAISIKNVASGPKNRVADAAIQRTGTRAKAILHITEFIAGLIKSHIIGVGVTACVLMVGDI
jgi:hypothetical protein